jgi:hypothetical protein
MNYSHYFTNEQVRTPATSLGEGKVTQTAYYIVEATELEDIQRRALIQDINDAINNAKEFIKERKEQGEELDEPKYEIEEKPMRVKFIASVEGLGSEVLNKLEEYLKSVGWGKTI